MEMLDSVHRTYGQNTHRADTLPILYMLYSKGYTLWKTTIATKRHPNVCLYKLYDSITLNLLLYIYRFWIGALSWIWSWTDGPINQSEWIWDKISQWEPDSFFVLSNSFQLEVNIFFWVSHKIGTFVYRFVSQFNTIYACNDIVDHHIRFFCVTIRNFSSFKKSW